MSDGRSTGKSLGALGGIGQALRSRNLVLYCSGLGFALTGTFAFVVALGWMTWEMTHSTAWVGTMVLAETIPNVVVSPFAGVIIDRTSAQRALFWAQLLASITVSAMTVVTFGEWMTIEILLGFVILLGACNGVAFPAHFAIMPRLVPRRDLSGAIAFQSSISQAARFAGPALAGIILVWFGVAAAFAFKAVSYYALLLALMLIRIDESKTRTLATPGVIDDLAAGVRYAWSSLTIRMLLVVAVALAIFLRPVVEIMPAFVGSVLKSGPEPLGWLLPAAGLGAVFASLWLTWRGATKGITQIMLLNFAATAVVLIAFLYSSSLALGVACLFVYGFTSSVVLISNQILIQNTVDDRMRARVMSLYGISIRALPALGAFIVGHLGEVFGLVPSLLGGGALGLLFWLWMRGAAIRVGMAEGSE
ncbi:MAG: hypothetical protein A3G25_19270 [Betaproteobacteria bacterium RIFCSPLOWO2_12_FULL_63_13]|nr:MAG: hypothetical protein A3G25_19270 [Betaproteobacteria bacterium RIFCSPLOWO2_12_FULL_63_13]